MRRFLIFVGIAALLIGMKMGGSLLVMKEFNADAEYVFFLQSGEISVPVSDAAAVRKGLTGVTGEAVRFNGTLEDVDAAINFLNGTVLREETVDGIIIIYGYSPKLGNAVTLSRNKINFQIAYSQNIITLGSPLIKGSY